MKVAGSLLGLVASMVVVGLAPPAAAQTATAALKDATGKEVGKADLTETPHGVLLKLSLKGFPAGERAFHIHAVGKCEPPFTSAGGHFNPTAKKHGMSAAEGRDKTIRAVCCINDPSLIRANGLSATS